MTTKDVAVKDAAGVINYDPALFPDLANADPREGALRLVERIFAAENEQEVFDALKGETSKNMVGRRLEFRDVAWQPFYSERGAIPNAICTAADLDSGEVVTFATTGLVLTASIRKLQLLGKVPFRARIVPVKTNSGQTALNFEAV